MKLFLTAILTALAITAVAQEPKENPEDVPGPGSFLGGGVVVGPDAFGYTGNDSDGGNCSTQFINITGSGVNLGTGDDVAFNQILPVGFDFYGVMVNEFAVASNGYLSTDNTDTGPDLSNDCPLPVTPSTGGGARIYPVQDDLITNGGIFYEYFANCPRPSDNHPGSQTGCHVFQWDDVNHFNGADSFGFEVILYNFSWEIVFIQGAGNSEAGSGSTTGIQNDGATIGLTYACNTAASIQAATAQCFVHPNPNLAGLAPQVVPVNNKYALLLLVALVGGFSFFVFRRKLQA